MHPMLAIALRAAGVSYPQCYPHQMWVISDATHCGSYTGSGPDDLFAVRVRQLLACAAV